jgi:hypothetical protein
LAIFSLPFTKLMAIRARAPGVKVSMPARVRCEAPAAIAAMTARRRSIGVSGRRVDVRHGSGRVHGIIVLA